MKTFSFELALQRLATILAIVALTLVLLAAGTGVLLAFYYDPSAEGAYKSLRFISESVMGGSLIRSLHDVAGNAIIVVALLQIFVMFFGRQFTSSWFTAWLSGGFLALFAIGLGWTAMILDWDQIGYWRLKVEISILGSLPVIGTLIRDLVLGGDSISTTTVEHMYTLHSYILSVVAVVLSVVHLAALLHQERRTLSSRASRAVAVNQLTQAAKEEELAVR